MRIALNLLGYTPKCGGAETYLFNMLRAFQELDDENHYLVICDAVAVDGLQSAGLNFELKVHNIEKPGLNWFLRGVIKRLCGRDLLSWQLRGLEIDVIHHPLTTLNPFGLPFPAILTVLDIQHEYFPELFSHKELNRRLRECQSSTQQASAVIAISQHVKDCLINRYELPSEKIFVVYLGYSRQFSPIEDQERKASTAEKYGLTRPFMFYPAATWAHKNHLLLLEAIHKLVAQGEFDGELILTGVPMNFHAQVLDTIDRLGLTKVVRWLGYVPEEDLLCLYNLARFLVFPSRFEGFGLPVVEAMACGCPAAVARAASLPEIAADAAAYFDPDSVEEMVSVLGDLWGNDEKLAQLRRKGLERAGSFRWEKTAQETLAVYRKVYLANLT